MVGGCFSVKLIKSRISECRLGAVNYVVKMDAFQRGLDENANANVSHVFRLGGMHVQKRLCQGNEGLHCILDFWYQEYQF